MVYIIMVLLCVIGGVLYYHCRGMCYYRWFISSWYSGVLLVMVYIIVVLWCVIGDGLYHHSSSRVVCYW